MFRSFAHFLSLCVNGRTQEEYHNRASSFDEKMLLYLDKYPDHSRSSSSTSPPTTLSSSLRSSLLSDDTVYDIILLPTQIKPLPSHSHDNHPVSSIECKSLSLVVIIIESHLYASLVQPAYDRGLYLSSKLVHGRQ